MSETLCLGDESDLYPHLRLDTQHEDARRLDAEVSDVKHLLALHLQPVTLASNEQLAVDGPRPAVEGGVALDTKAAVISERGHLPHLADDAGEAPGVDAALQFGVLHRFAGAKRSDRSLDEAPEGT